MTPALWLVIVVSLAILAAKVEGEVGAERDLRRTMRDRARRLKEQQDHQHNSDWYGRTPR